MTIDDAFVALTRPFPERLHYGSEGWAREIRLILGQVHAEGRRSALQEIETKLRPRYQGHVHKAAWDDYTEGQQDAFGHALAVIEAALAQTGGEDR